MSLSAVDWIDARQPPAPAPVRASLAAALARLDPGSADAGPDLADRLAGAALALLSEVAGGAGDRTSAADLLAADALLTYAIEAAAEEGRGSLDRLLAALTLDRFERILSRGDVEP